MPIETDVAMLEIQASDVRKTHGGARVSVRLNKRPSAEWSKLLQTKIEDLAKVNQVLLSKVRVAVEPRDAHSVIAFDVSAEMAKAIHGHVKELVNLTNAAAIEKNKQDEDKRLNEESAKAASEQSFESIVQTLTGLK
jgi:nitrogen-specific signal transduction histidine kinase